MQKKKESKEFLLNSKKGDSGAKLLFGDNGFCAEFIRDYIDIPYAKDVKAEDIVDVSEQFVPLFAEEREADVVKRINVREGVPFFLISLLEHKTKVDYNVHMQIFRYMVFIWDAYEKEMEKQKKGISKRAGFKYPPIIPIVYYEGKKNWTVPPNFKSRIWNGHKFGKYVPDFEYYLLPLKSYSNEELINHGDGISLAMMINKLQSKEDIEDFCNLPPDKVEKILNTMPEYQKEIVAKVYTAVLMKMNVPMDIVQELVGRVKKKKMAELFGAMEKIDVQAEWRKMDKVRNEIARQQEEIEAGKQEIEAGKQEIEAGKQEIEAGKQEIEAGKQEIEAGKQEIEAGKQEIENEKQEIENEKQKLIQERERIEKSTKFLLKSFVETLQELGVTKENAMKKITESYKLSKAEAEKIVQDYWK